MAPSQTFKKYIKNQVGPSDRKITSVSIREDQSKFLDKNNLNLSAIVRDAIDELMKRRESK